MHKTVNTKTYILFLTRTVNVWNGIANKIPFLLESQHNNRQDLKASKFVLFQEIGGYLNTNDICIKSSIGECVRYKPYKFWNVLT